MRILFTLSCALFAALLAVACDGNDSDSSDGGNTDTDTDSDSDSDSDSDTDEVNCQNTSFEFGTFLAEKCFCPGDGAQTLEVTDEASALHGLKAVYTEGTFDECVIAIIARANFPADALVEDEDGALCDAQNPDNKILSADGVVYKAISAANPYGDSGYNEIEPKLDVTLTFPSWFGSVMKWLSEASTPHFEIVQPTVVDSMGAMYLTDTFSAYAVLNRPFGGFSVSFVPGDTNGYDVNGDGVLIEVTLADEEQTAFPTWVTFEIKDGSTAICLIPQSEPNRFRLPLFNGQHDLTFSVSDINIDPAYRHHAEDAKSIDLTVDLCESVVCEDDGDLCNGNENCDPSDGECKHYDPLTCDDGLACNGLETCIPETGCINPADIDCGDYGDCTEPFGSCSCDTGYDPATNCTSCAAGYTGYPTCVADLCYGVSCPDDGNVCNGSEVCDSGTGDCVHVDSLVCDDNDACNGLETCDPVAGCQNGTPLVCDDNDVCNGIETCDSVLGCQSGTLLTCDDGLACNGTETCDALTGCANPPDVDCGDHGSCTEPSGSCNCTDGWTGDNCEVPPLPTITIVELDCSGGSAPGWCMIGETYPLIFTSTDADTFTASQVLNCGVDGTFDPESGDVTGSPMNISYTDGVCDGPITLKIEVCNVTGCASDTLDVETY
ncbi:MAG: hypothetical protein PHU25_01200 [Deltaproteobacteria bacterium]|nr:hypothetical protein [Deltaproteobacteria bacterium]